MFDYGTPRPKALYAEARRQGKRSQRTSLFGRGARRLLSLAEVETASTVHARSYAGVRDVPIAQIRGSEGRCNDFDQSFHPLQDHNQARWLRVAAARHRGKTLPPVELIQVGEVYFVRDGHHRISVARAVGQMDIEAEVTVWDVAGPLPWEAQPRPTAQRRPAGDLLGAVQHVVYSIRHARAAAGDRRQADPISA
jgi:hypothetical protein